MNSSAPPLGPPWEGDEPGGSGEPDDAFGPYGPGGDMLLPSEKERIRREEKAKRNPGRRVARATSKAVVTRVQDLFSTGGPAFNVLANSVAAATAGDTLIAIALANTLFFSVPSTEARGNVVLYLLITVAPFAVIGPVLGAILDRPGAERIALFSSAALRVFAAVGLMLLADTVWLFPLALALLVLSRAHGIARSALLPQALDNAVALVTANARLAQIGVLSGAAIVPVGAGLAAIGPAPVLITAAVMFGVSAWQAMRLPDVTAADTPTVVLEGETALDRALSVTMPDDPPAPTVEEDEEKDHVPAAVRTQLRLARFATAVVRLLNGFLVLILAFAFRDVDAPLADFGAVLGAAGGGFALAALAAPRLERTLREEPMVVAALAVEAAAAFLAGQFFGLGAAVVLALAAGYAWGTAKFAFDGLLQSSLPPKERGRAFTRSETMFQLAWVLGAVIPTGLTIDVHLGLPIAGVVALLAQTIYVSRLLRRI